MRRNGGLRHPGREESFEPPKLDDYLSHPDAFVSGYSRNLKSKSFEANGDDEARSGINRIFIYLDRIRCKRPEGDCVSHEQ